MAHDATASVVQWRVQDEVRRVSAELAAINSQLADTRKTLETTQRERQPESGRLGGLPPLAQPSQRT